MVIEADSLHRQRRQRIMALVAHAGRVDRSVGADGNGGDLPPRRLEEHVALALRIDAVDQSRAVGAGNQVALRVPCQSADMRLVALEKQFRRGAWLGWGRRGRLRRDCRWRCRAARLSRRSDPRCSGTCALGVSESLALAGSSRVQPWRRRRQPWRLFSSSFAVAPGLSL